MYAPPQPQSALDAFNNAYDIDQVRAGIARGQTTVLDRLGNQHPASQVVGIYEKATGQPLALGGQQDPSEDFYTAYGNYQPPATQRLGGSDTDRLQRTYSVNAKPFSGFQKAVGAPALAAIGVKQRAGGYSPDSTISSFPPAAQSRMA